MTETTESLPLPPWRELNLYVDRRTVTFQEGSTLLTGTPPRIDPALEARLRRFRSKRFLSSDPVEAEAELHGVGRKLAETFLPQEILAALQRELARATALDARILLGIEIGDHELELLPWETLWLPGSSQPLALAPHVELYRRVTVPSRPQPPPPPGPLRILVTVASPFGLEGRLDLLDMERELARILAGLESVRRESNTELHILERGNLAAIRGALSEKPYHVLHVSSHARPGELVLEDEQGRPDLVTAARFFEAALPEAIPPLIVLAGCATAVGGKSPEGDALPAVAHELVIRGAPAVLAMQADVTDRYATDFTAEFFAILAESERLDPISALANARRSVEKARRSTLRQPRRVPEWPTPTLYVTGPRTRRYQPYQTLRPRLDSRHKAYRHGEFVGRRREIRLLLQTLEEPASSCAVIHGIGGIGKTALARQFVDRLRDQGWTDISITDGFSVPGILRSVSNHFQGCRSSNLQELANLIGNEEYPTKLRTDLLFDQIPKNFKLVLVCDGFETQLDADGTLRDAELTAFLDRWLRSTTCGRLLVTSRRPVKWREGMEKEILELPLGPLSPAETRKLFWRLPALRKLPAEDLAWLYEQLGGHPLALKTFAALLKQQEDVEAGDDLKLEQATETRSVLPSVVATLVDETSIDDLLARLEPGARELLVAASVYRLPVDRSGLIFQMTENLEEIRGSLNLPTVKAQFPGYYAVIAAPLLQEEGLLRGAQINDFGSTTGPVELSIPEKIDSYLDELLDLELMARSFTDSDRYEASRYLVHRWLSHFLLKTWSDDQRCQAHHRAATYWLWQAKQSNFLEPIRALAEARHHYREASRVGEAVEVSQWMSAQLHLWSEWTWERSLCQETLSWLPDRSPATATFQHQLGLIAHEQGHYGEARAWYERALKTSRWLDDKAAEAATMHQLGVLARTLGELTEAESLLNRALEIKLSLGETSPLASSYHELAALAETRGQLAKAEELYRKACELGDDSGRAKSLHQLGNLMLTSGLEPQAESLYQEAAAIFDRLGDRASLASSLHQLGVLAQRHGSYDAAFEHLHRAIAIEEAVGDRASLANTRFQLGHLARETDSLGEAIDAYRQALNLYEVLGDALGVARTSYQLGLAHHEQGNFEEAEIWYRRAVDHFSHLGDRVALARSLLHLGAVLGDQKQTDQAETSLQQAADLFEDADALAEAKAAHRRLGKLLLQETSSNANAEKAKAFATLSRVLVMARRYEDRQLAAAALHLYSSQLEGEEHIESIAVEAEIAQLDSNDIWIAAELASLRSVQRRYQEAINLARSVIARDSSEVPTSVRVRALYTLGEAQLALGSDDGLGDLHRGLELARKADARSPLVAEGYLRLGNARLLRQDFEDARLAYLMAAALYQHLDLPAKVAMCYRLLILLSREVGRESDADHFRQVAHDYFERIGHPEWLRELPADRRLRAG